MYPIFDDQGGLAKLSIFLNREVSLSDQVCLKIKHAQKFCTVQLSCSYHAAHRPKNRIGKEKLEFFTLAASIDIFFDPNVVFFWRYYNCDLYL